MVELLSKPPLVECRTRLRNSRSCSLLLVCAIAVASSGCAQLQPSPSSDPIKRLDNIMDSSAYFFPRPQPNGGDAYGAAFVRNPSVIKGNELPAIQGAQAYGKRMLEGAAAARDCGKSHDPDTATSCKEFVTKFCDRAQSAFELSQNETDWWRANSPTSQNQPTAAKSIHEPPKLIPQTRLVACGIDKIQVVQGYDVGGTSQIATSVAAEKPKAKGAAPVAPASTGAIAAAAAAPKEVKGVVATAPPVKKTEIATLVKLPPAPKQEDAHPSKVAPQTARAKAVTASVQVPDAGTEAFRTTLAELPPAPKQEDVYPSKVATQTARAKAVTAPVQVPDAGTEPSRDARLKGSRVAAVSGDKSIKPQDNKSTPTNAPVSSVVTGFFAGQVFGSSGGHSFSADLILTLEGAGKELKGAWIAEQGKTGLLTGILSGSKIAVLRLKQLEPCAGSYDASVVIVEDGERLRGSYTGTDCKGQVDAAFNVAKP